jgi:hypothetical protein
MAIEPGECSQQRRLARTCRANQSHDALSRHFKTDIRQDDPLAIRHTETPK